MPPNEKTLALIEAAKKRTAELLSRAQSPEPPQLGLPSAISFNNKNKTVAAESNIIPLAPIQNTTITIKNNTFDPYEMPGIGRANKEQASAIKLFGLEGASGCLIGPAGTGKTTTMKPLLITPTLSRPHPLPTQNTP